MIMKKYTENLYEHVQMPYAIHALMLQEDELSTMKDNNNEWNNNKRRLCEKY